MTPRLNLDSQSSGDEEGNIELWQLEAPETIDADHLPGQVPVGFVAAGAAGGVDSCESRPALFDRMWPLAFRPSSASSDDNISSVAGDSNEPAARQETRRIALSDHLASLMQHFGLILPGGGYGWGTMANIWGPPAATQAEDHGEPPSRAASPAVSLEDPVQESLALRAVMLGAVVVGQEPQEDSTRLYWALLPDTARFLIAAYLGLVPP